ncbi:MAG: DUF421 domain-containing protein [Clostridia bacterium]|nr:DUF421 domain-containing protein [Clostridia bacterium]
MLLIFCRSIILYVFVLIIMRIMGKREISQLQPFEFVISMMIANLATIPMEEVGIPLLYGLIPILGLLITHIILSIANLKSMRLRGLICGIPRIVIHRGKIVEEALRKESMSLNELEERLRAYGITNIGDVEYAILETNGQLSIIEKPEKRQVRTEDLNIDAEYEGIAYDLVLDGKVMYDNLKKIGKDYNWLRKEVSKFNMSPEEALIVIQNGDKSMFCQKKEKKQ